MPRSWGLQLLQECALGRLFSAKERDTWPAAVQKWRTPPQEPRRVAAACGTPSAKLTALVAPAVTICPCLVSLSAFFSIPLRQEGLPFFICKQFSDTTLLRKSCYFRPRNWSKSILPDSPFYIGTGQCHRCMGSSGSVSERGAQLQKVS